MSRFQIPIFALAKTTVRREQRMRGRCESLSNSYLCFSENNESLAHGWRFHVVSRFQIPIFALAKTTKTIRYKERERVVSRFQIPIFALAKTTTTRYR